MRFLNHINHMRGIAIIPIVAVHSIDIFDWRVSSFGEFMSPLFVDMNILFVFVSGYLFDHLSVDFEYFRYLYKKLVHVVVPYVLVSLPAIVIYINGVKAHPHLPPEFFEAGGVEQAVFFLGTGAHLGPLWFIPMMVVLYLLSPLLLALSRSRLAPWTLPAAFAVALAVGRPAHNLGPLQLALHFMPIYLLGMLFSRHAARLEPTLRAAAGRLVVAGLAAAAASVTLPALGVPVPHLALKTVICVAVFALMLSLPQRRIGVLDLLARYAFGIFLVHGYLVGLGRILSARAGEPVYGSLPRVALATCLVLAVSVGIVAAAQSVLGSRSRYLLGT